MADVTDADLQAFANRVAGRESPLTEEQRKRTLAAFVRALGAAPVNAPTQAMLARNPENAAMLQSVNSRLSALTPSAVMVRAPRAVQTAAIPAPAPQPVVIAEDPTTERLSNADEDFVDEYGQRKAPFSTETRR